MDARALCSKLVKSESTNEVIRALQSVGYWDDPSVWINYGDQENNWGTGGNQQDNAEGALVEKIVNSIDAVLMRECLLRGINPEDIAEAPQSMYSAVEEFFGIRDGALESVTGTERTKLAGNIMLVATGAKRKPCISIIDKGEGQTPNSFENTLVSIGKSNKVRIGFVQGKYNQGGMGVIAFSGYHGLQLIISKRHPKLVDKSDSSGSKWGFTIVRLFPPDEHMKNYSVKYLAPGGKVLFFDEPLKLVPGNYPEAYSETLEWGTYVKLYDYEFSGSYYSNIRMNLFFRLSFLLPRLALPVRMIERRDYGSDKHETTLAGLEVRLREYGKDSIEPNFPYPGKITVSGSPVTCTIYVFKKKTKAYTSGEGVAFIENGQTQAWLSNRIFLSEKVGLGYIANTLLVLVHCDELPRHIRARMFMGSRDRVRNNEFMRNLSEKLKELVKDDPALRELNNLRRQKEKGKPIEEDEEFLRNLQDLLRKSPGLSYLFNPGKKLNNPFNLDRVDVSDEVYSGSMWPTYFTLKSKRTKEVPKGSRFKMVYETDAANDYFDRADTPGTFTLMLHGNNPDYQMLLRNGLCTLTVTLPRSTKVGEILKYISIVKDHFHEEDSFQSEFSVEVTDEPHTFSQGSKPTHKPPGREGTGYRRKSDELDFLRIEQIWKNQWNSDDNEFTAVRATPVNGRYDLKINMDNIFFLHELKARKISKAELEAKYVRGMYFITLSLLQKDDRTSLEVEDELGLTKGELVSKVTKAIAPVIMPIILDL